MLLGAVSVGAVLTACSASPNGNPETATSTTIAVASGPAVPSAGCTGSPVPAVTEQRRDVLIQGVDRWYLLTTPSPNAPGRKVDGRRTPAGPASPSAIARPLVLDFHGLGEGASIHARTTQFGPLSQKDGFVVAFPNGSGTPVQWDTSATSSPNPDLQFVSSLLDQIESQQCIDTSRVYASGLSDGSFMVSLLACTMSTRFAAVGAVSGLVVPSPCNPTRRVPIVTFHGTADPILLFNGGIGTATLNYLLGRGPPPSTSTTVPAKLDGPGVPATVRTWAHMDGCGSKQKDVPLGTQVILRTYKCPPNSPVDFYIIIGGGHSWPGSKFSQSISKLTGFTTFQISATDKMWAFFQQFRL